jgi:polyisoprenyl-teichoic acid--peptidoglycan teichoic acid transferase
MTKRNRQLQLIKLNKSLIKLLASNPHEKRSLFDEPARSSSPKRKNGRKNLFLIGFISFLVIFSVFFGATIAVFSRFALVEAFLTMMSTSPYIGEANILVIGLDSNGGSHRSDTIMVVHVSPQTKNVNVVSLPRDTIMNVPGIGLTKVNHSFAYGGTQLTRRTLESFFNIKIPFTVSINMDGLAKIIDTLGGLNINVDKRMYYVDYAGGLYVDLYPGWQHLNGRQALGYVRFRHDAQGDFGRIARQQKFVQALANRIITKKNVLSAPRVILSLLSNVETNMSVRQVLGLSLAMRQSFDIGNIRTTSIAGEPVMIDRVYYLRPDLDEIKKLTSDYLRPQIRKREATNKWRQSHS